MTSDYNLSTQIIVILLAPPVIAKVACLLFRSWTGVLGTANQPWAQNWLGSLFWAATGAGYVIGVAMFVLARFIR